ncbi:MAG TPA: pyridoxamine 5'-phosphate oxidase family protein [Acidimicrobiales bacterium]|nr:pyridoxamine 5'-phosphate oxidase family protein [Acidimicrobiales bacterium]
MTAGTLGREECLELLAMASMGRVALSANALPTVLPVSFRLIGDRIVFRTGGRRSTPHVVAFQVDDIDPQSHVGWSIVVTGVAHEVTDPAELAEMESAVPPEWTAGDEARLVALSLERVAGHRLVEVP